MSVGKGLSEGVADGGSVEHIEITVPRPGRDEKNEDGSDDERGREELRTVGSEHQEMHTLLSVLLQGVRAIIFERWIIAPIDMIARWGFYDKYDCYHICP